MCILRFRTGAHALLSGRCGHSVQIPVADNIDDDSFLVFTVAMYGGINAFRDKLDNPYYLGALSKPSPLDDRFDSAYFDRLVTGAKPNLSAKAFLATEQRIPGLGNGVLQDILFNARIHPKRKMAALGGRGLDALFGAVKSTLAEMAAAGGPGYGKGSFRQSPAGTRLCSRKIHIRIRALYAKV